MFALPNVIAAPHPQVRAHTNPLTTVFVWELRRLRASPFTWRLVLGTAFLFAVLLVLKHSWDWDTNLPSGEQFIIYLTTPVGVFLEFVSVQLLVFGMVLPFLTTDAVAREHPVRMHELLMTTPVPTWAFVVGRFLVALCLAFGLAFLLLVVVAAAAFILPITDHHFPFLDPAVLVQTWALLVVLPTFFVTAICFTLGTLLPRLSTPIKLLALVAWFLLWLLSNPLDDLTGGWLVYLNPTGMGVWLSLMPAFQANVTAQLANTANLAQHAQIALQLQQQPLDLSAWVLPYLGLVGLGLALVACAAFGFQRFRNVMN